MIAVSGGLTALSAAKPPQTVIMLEVGRAGQSSEQATTPALTPAEPHPTAIMKKAASPSATMLFWMSHWCGAEASPRL
jgi:hypothetical protein